ncbi:XdhC family protein [Hymenobacter arizonensis]|uniref:Xanthine and CO dehydrogenase maturation factor, XdhC/CoxF family n=1 Tax=Hymenobacter arizonensis TaxID=1227077 RepID=A0A1I5SV04_HYMAR|nr:XdhC/CoxI family protein [Hymenobacter arizonensis]SFP74573.1 Xanthine and CO dehydrogenase maturation factor, XdhC/CoxF family [Hymenobacter arizonensis]
MTELQRLLLAYDQHRADARPCALATVVEVLGSAYRRPGARMLVTDDGQLTGAISGGCLEGDARQRARQAIFRGQPALVTYDTRDEDDPRHGLGPGCQGVVRILLEPLDYAAPNNPMELLRSFAQHPEPAVLATVFETDSATGLRAGVGQRLLLTANGDVRGLPALATPLAEAAHAALAGCTSQVLDIETDAGPVRALLELLTPPLRVIIYGAGNDAQPLVRLAASLGWHITVVDGRPNLATAARFPEAAEVRVVPVAAIAQERPGDAYAVLLSHNYAYDLAALTLHIPSPTPYIGLLGPHAKATRLLAELNLNEHETEELRATRLHSPIGLDLGSETPEEIALAIVAEIQAKRHQRNGRPLRERADAVHAPVLALHDSF